MSLTSKVCTVFVAFAASAAVAACGGTTGQPTSSAGTGSNHPTESSKAQSTSAAATTTTTEAKTHTATLGQAFTYSNGLAVTVSTPKPFTPSKSAATGKSAAAYVLLTVTVVNKTPDVYNPVLLRISAQSGNTEAEKVYDSANGVGGAPSTKVLVGRETSFKVGLGVANPADLVVQVSPGMEYKDVIFAS